MRLYVPIRTDRPSGLRGARGLVVGALLILSASTARAQAPEAAPAPGQASSLSRYIPREGLAAYLEFDGVDTHRDAWKASAAYKVLNETSLGATLEDIVRQLVAMSQAPFQPADVLGALEQVARQGLAVGVIAKDPDDVHWVYVIRGAGRGDARRMVDFIMGQLPGATVEKAGRTIHTQQSMSWWFEKDDLVATDQLDAILAALDGREPSAIDHPIRAPLAKGEAGFVPLMLGFIDFPRLAAMDAQTVRLGLDGVKRLDFVLGFEGEATRSMIHLAAPSPRRGLLAMLDQPTFDAGSLPSIPAGVHGFTALSVDWAKTYDRIAELIPRPTRPAEAGPDRLAQMEEGIRQFGFDLRKDLLAGLGPKVAFSLQDPAGGARGSHAAALINRLGGATIAMEVRDRAAVSRSFDGLAKMANLVLANAAGGPQGGAKLELRKVGGDRPAYGLDLPEGLLPPPFSTMFRPTIVLGPEQLVLGASAAAADRAADLTAAKADGRWSPDAAYEPVMRRLPGKMIALRISDPRELMPAVVEALPVLARMINSRMEAQRRQFPGMPARPGLNIEPDRLPKSGELIARLFPASTALVVDDDGVRLISREPFPGPTSPVLGGMLAGMLMTGTRASTAAAKRAQCVNDLKQIGLAMHNYHSANNAFPAPAIVDKDGKPLLSWRVAILPYVEQQELYNKFKLDEPWDSPHNKALIKEMPRLYLCPDRKDAEPGTTTYRVFVGEGPLFQEGAGTPLQAVTDGTSNTVMVVESTDAVAWTKPDDLKFDPAAQPSLRGAGSPHKGGFNVLFADGAVRFIKTTINLQVWRALITRAGGEVIAADAF